MSDKHTQGRISHRISQYEQEAFDLVLPGIGAIGIIKSEADARRMVACWNACEGLPTAWIEGGAADILEHAKSLKSQRDELLAALRSLMACAGVISASPDSLLQIALEHGDEETRHQANAWLAARAAIAKVEGGAA